MREALRLHAEATYLSPPRPVRAGILGSG
jgi:hypothetical protein